ncbi:MAG: type II secretion system protein [Chlamydiota bacterium]|nr:type II secretion system protein [Chlamydiota bacterium]
MVHDRFHGNYTFLDKNKNRAFTLLELLISIAIVIVLWTIVSHVTIRAISLRRSIIQKVNIQHEVVDIFKHLRVDIENAFSGMVGDDKQTTLDIPFIDGDGRAKMIYQWKQSVLKRMIKENETGNAITVNEWENIKQFQLLYRVQDEWLNTLYEDQKIEAMYVRIIYGDRFGKEIIFQKIIPVWNGKVLLKRA